jgi:hypothetical protein
MINAMHWLGVQVVGTIGRKETPVRAMIHAAAGHLSTPVTPGLLVVEAQELSGPVSAMCSVLESCRRLLRSVTSAGAKSHTNGSCLAPAHV